MIAPDAKRYLFDTHRSVEPGQTLDRVRPFFARMGITRVANLTGLDRIGLPTVMVTRPNSRSVAVSLGKGLTRAAAEASGVMEAIETWHAERVRLPLRLASPEEIAEDGPVAEIRRLPRVSGSRLDPARRLLWVEGRGLAGGGPIRVPYEMVHADYRHPPPPGHGCFPRSTNGLASGNDVAEATCHALCEVIERDATTLWHHRPAAAQDAVRVDPASVDDAACRAALDLFAAAGVEVGIWETTSDIGVAAFHCVICEGVRPGHIGIGDGCHPHRGIALLRALTEAAQTRLTYISGARDDLAPAEYAADAIARKCGYARRLLDRAPARRDFRDAPSASAATFGADLAWLVGRLGAAGLPEAVVVDLSRDDIGVAVVRVVVPGLEAPHDDADFLPGARARAAGGATA